jgi:hypothetical protein
MWKLQIQVTILDRYHKMISLLCRANSLDPHIYSCKFSLVVTPLFILAEADNESADSDDVKETETVVSIFVFSNRHCTDGLSKLWQIFNISVLGIEEVVCMLVIDWFVVRACHTEKLTVGSELCDGISHPCTEAPWRQRPSCSVRLSNGVEASHGPPEPEPPTPFPLYLHRNQINGSSQTVCSVSALEERQRRGGWSAGEALLYRRPRKVRPRLWWICLYVTLICFYNQFFARFWFRPTQHHSEARSHNQACRFSLQFFNSFNSIVPADHQ